jgi:hypothetical protein
MKISARASGGVAGRTDRFELDTGCRDDGAAIEALLERLDFFSAAPPAGVGADLVRWEITADDGRRCHTVVLHEDGNAGVNGDGGPDAAGWPALLAHLRASARGRGA